MNKKLMAVAVAGALAAPAMAFAQTTIYGSFNAEYGIYSAPDSTVNNNNWDGLNSGASNIGFKGEEKLAGGMAAFYQCESDVRFMSGSGRTSGSICDRNSAVGLKGGFGAVSIGTWDSPQKIAVGKTRITADTGWLGVTHILWNESNRNANSINYSLPDFGGLSIDLQTTTTNAASGTTGDGKKGRNSGANAVYTKGPLVLALGYTGKSDNAASGTINGAKDTAYSFGGAYTFGPAKVGLTYVSEKQEAGANETKSSGYNLAGSWELGGGNNIWAGYTKRDANKLNGTKQNDGGSEIQVGFGHDLSKRTLVAVGYGKVANDDNGTYTVGGTASTGVIAGNGSSVFTLQVKHNF